MCNAPRRAARIIGVMILMVPNSSLVIYNLHYIGMHACIEPLSIHLPYLSVFHLSIHLSLISLPLIATHAGITKDHSPPPHLCIEGEQHQSLELSQPSTSAVLPAPACHPGESMDAVESLERFVQRLSIPFFRSEPIQFLHIL